MNETLRRLTIEEQDTVRAVTGNLFTRVSPRTWLCWRQSRWK
jgi:hypothetical protein